MELLVKNLLIAITVNPPGSLTLLGVFVCSHHCDNKGPLQLEIFHIMCNHVKAASIMQYVIRSSQVG